MAQTIQTETIQWRSDRSPITSAEVWYPVVETGSMPRFRVERLDESQAPYKWKARDLFQDLEVRYAVFEDALEWCAWQTV